MGDLMVGRRWITASVVICVVVSGCSVVRRGQPAEEPVSDVPVTVLDEKGARLEGAAFDPVGDAGPVALSPDGTVGVRGPTAGVLSLDGYLPEPVVLDPSEPGREIRLYARTGPTGKPRVALHFAGDTMMGRRYQQPTREGTPVVKDEAEARAVVAAVAPLMAAADVSTVNAETVVGDLPAAGAYPGKLFQLQSPPAFTAALTEMGIDLVMLGNNHIRDWRDAGVASTLREIQKAGMASVGAGMTAEEAQRGKIVTAGPVRVGVVSMTTIDGDFLNSGLPAAGVPPPADLPAEDTWQYTDRKFGFGKPGEPGYIPSAPRRPGDLWRLFDTLEPTLDPARTAQLWAAMTAPGAVPEFGDWVARRGHGGAAKFSTAGITAEVAALRAAGAEIVMVQLHGGYMFTELPGASLREISRRAVDAGADLVINHHPHVVQGLEWYKGKLIGYSLGNLIFDQDYAATFPSMIVRAVFEGPNLLKARLVPVLIDDYRPTPLSGSGEQRVLQMIDQRSALAAVSERTKSGRIVSVADAAVVPNAAVDIGDGAVLTERKSEFLEVALDAQGFARIDRCAVLRPSNTSLRYGTDLVGWGAFNDVTANGTTDPAPRFELHGDVTLVSADGRRFLRLDGQRHFASVRPLAHADLIEHRRYSAVGRPLDGTAEYRLQLDARFFGRGPLIVRTGWYSVDDLDPNEQPESKLLSEQQVELPASGGQWRTLTVDLPDPFGGRDVKPDAVSVSIVLPGGAGRLDLDNVALYEWRKPKPALVDTWLAAGAVRGEPGTKVTLQASGCAPR